jgi:serine protease AprX
MHVPARCALAALLGGLVLGLTGTDRWSPVLPVDAAGPSLTKLDTALQRRAARTGGRSRVIVRVAPGTPAQPVRTAIRALGGSVGRHLPGIRSHAATVPDAALSGLARHPFIERLWLDRPVSGAVERTAATIGADAVQQELGYDGAGIGIAIIDSGVMASHDDLSADSAGPRVVRFVDFISGSSAAYDDHGHGTHVAGIIAGSGQLSAGRRRGIAPGARLVVLKALDSSGQGRISDVIAALEYAVANRAALNIRIVNLSLAAAVYESFQTDPLGVATERAVRAGLVVVAAAGNNGVGPEGRARYGGVTAPGNSPWVLTVGSSSHMGTIDRADDSVPAFSSRGPAAIDHTAKPDIVAPGVGIESLAAPGSRLYTSMSPFLLAGTVDSSFLPYLSLTGTSMAAPVVTGTVALMLQANPAMTPNLVKAILQYTSRAADEYDPLTRGAGFLNAEGAVRLAGALTSKSSATIAGSSEWKRRVLWGNYAIHDGQLSAGASAWSTDVRWGTPTIKNSSVSWGVTCSTPSCDSTSGPWTWNTARARNVVWGSVCGGADCTGAWRLSTVNGASQGDTVVWGTTTEGETVVWGSNQDGDTVVWGTDSTDTVVWGTSEADTVVWGTGCMAPACYPKVWE